MTEYEKYDQQLENLTKGHGGVQVQASSFSGGPREVRRMKGCQHPVAYSPVQTPETESTTPLVEAPSRGLPGGPAEC